MLHTGLDARKPVFGGLRTTKAQTRLRIRAVESALLLERFICRRATREISIFYLVFVAEQAGLSLVLSETPKTGFVATRPITRPKKWFLSTSITKIEVLLQLLRMLDSYFRQSGFSFFFLSQHVSLTYCPAGVWQSTFNTDSWVVF